MAETVLSDVCGQTSVRTLPACSFAVWRQSGMNIDEAAEQRVRKRAQSPRSERQPGSFERMLSAKAITRFAGSMDILVLDLGLTPRALC